MFVSEIMTAQVACCRPGDHDDRAAQLMWENDCGVLPVIDAGGRAVGVVTDRDLCMAAYTRGRGLGELTVADAMSRQVFGCQEGDSVAAALETMCSQRVRRLPVLDAEGRVVGILSVNDVVRAAQQSQRREREAILTALLEALGAICEPREAAGAEIVPQARRKGRASRARKSPKTRA